MDEPVSNAGAVLTIAALLVVSLVLTWLFVVIPVNANTHWDDFSTDVSSDYFFVITSRMYWNSTTETVDRIINSPSTGSGYYMAPNDTIFSGGNYSVKIQQVKPYHTQTNNHRDGIVFASDTNTFVASAGNRYYVWFDNSSFPPMNKIRIAKTVAGSHTVILMENYQIPYGNWNTLTVNWKQYNLSSINVYINDSHVVSVEDSTFFEGVTGLTAYYGSYTRFDDWRINESTVSAFTCTPTSTTTGTSTTCTQTGDNYNDPGVRSWWVWGDGEDSNSWGDATASHAFTAAGTYTVSLLNENVAGSSSEVKRDYVTISGPTLEGTQITASEAEIEDTIYVEAFTFGLIGGIIGFMVWKKRGKP